MSLIYDRRQIKVTIGHPQRRVKKPRVGVTARGWDFLSTDPANGMWVSPVTGVLQSIPNSEEPEYQTTPTGRWAKFKLADVDTIDVNTPTVPFRMATAQGMHAESEFYYTGNNTAGVGAITKAAFPENTGLNVAQYVYGSGSETQGVLMEFGWGDVADYTSGVSVRVYHNGQVEIYYEGKLVGRGSFSGSGYEFGSAQGGSYARQSDKYVQIRAEASRGRYLLLTSSVGGVFQFDCPWAVEQRNAEGIVTAPAKPVLPAKKAWFRVPEGGCSVVWSKVEYAPSGTALSEEFALSEPPNTTGSTGAFSARAIPVSDDVTVSLVDPDGTTFTPTQNRCRVKVEASSAPVWIDGTSTRYDPLTALTIGEGEDEEGHDVTEWITHFSWAVHDGPEGMQGEIELASMIWRFEAPEEGDEKVVVPYPNPITDLAEIESWPVKIELVPHPDDEDPLEPLVLLDGILGPAKFIDGLREVDGQTISQTRVYFGFEDRLSLLKDAEVSETVTFDGSDFCKPPSVGDSAVWVCLRQAGLTEADVDLPDLDFKIEHVPPQKAGEWSFSAKAGDKWWDVLMTLFDLAPSLIWGIKPTVDRPKFFVIDPEMP